MPNRISIRKLKEHARPRQRSAYRSPSRRSRSASRSRSRSRSPPRSVTDRAPLLVRAARDGDMSIVKYLVETLRVDVNNPPSYTPLRAARDNKRAGVVRYLRKHGALD